MYYKFKSASAYGLCIGVVFGTAASLLGKVYANLMSKYITGSAVSIVALLSIQGLIQSETQSKQTPLQHLKVLNYQSYSMSTIPPTKMPMNIHSRFI
ncbi:hypothetical protein BD770DRAFT_214381 [Pilaira anomala]|nr:hypothetical protein BD770DRAFT_214381 [Pilaira anomala]